MVCTNRIDRQITDPTVQDPLAELRPRTRMPQKGAREVRPGVGMARFGVRRPVLIVIGMVPGVDDQNVAALDLDVVLFLPGLDMIRAVDVLFPNAELLQVLLACRSFTRHYWMADDIEARCV